MRVEVIYSIESGLHIGVFTPFQECGLELLDMFREELNSKPDVLKRIKARGKETQSEILKEYLICFYGGNDNLIDVDGQTSTPDYCHCGNRGHCPDEGFTGLCSIPTVGDIKLSKSEVEIISFHAHDKSVKEIASIRRRSIHTVETQVRSLRAKLSAHSMSSVLAKTSALGIH